MLIKKNGDDLSIGIFVKNDFEPVSVGNISTYEIKKSVSDTNEMELSNTYNDSYEGIKLFGKSEQKAEWRQAEGVTGQAVTVDGQGKNQFDKERITDGFISLTGVFEKNTNYPNSVYLEYPITLKAGESLTITSPVDFRFRQFDMNDNYIDTPANRFTASADCKVYVLFYLGISEQQKDSVQVEKNKTATEYEDYVHESPSPAYPSELTTNIPAGSYQIPAENGIYEVTLAEDLRGIDDTYRDRICFDSVSGTGYRLNHVGKKEFDETTSFDAWQRVKNFGFRTPLENCSTGTPFSDYSLCTQFKNNYELAYGGNGGYFGTGDAYFNGCMDSGEVNNLAQLSAFLKQEKEKGTPVTVYYVLKTPVKEALTFTKVPSSSLPVLPWTAYGRNLFDGIFESGFYTADGETGSTNYIRSANYIPVQPNTRYYVLNNKPDDTFLWYDSGKNFLSEVSDLNEPSPANACYLRFFFYGTDKMTQYMLCSGAKPTAYEPFNPTPPEALEVSPDYPQKIYDLSGVTVTSRGRNLFDVNDWYAFLRGYTTTYVSKAILDGYACIKYQPPITYNKPYMKGCFKENTQYTICFKARQDSINPDTSSGFVFIYTDGERHVVAGVENTTEWKTYVGVSRAGKTIDHIEMGYNYGYPIYIIENSVQLLEGAYTAETLPPFDRYRCTEAEVPVTLRSCGEDADCVVSDGSAVKWNACVKELIIDGTRNNFVCNMMGSAGDHRCQFYVKNNAITYDRLKQGSVMKNSHGFATQVKADGSNYLPYIVIPWAVLGLTSTPTAAEATEAAKSYCAAQNAAGNPLVIRYVLNTPIITDCTDEAWAQDLLGLKTAPYYTRLFADKETGGLRCFYKTFQTGENEVMTGYLLTSDGEYVVTNDGKTVIQF